MPRANNFAGAPAEREAHGVRTMAIEFRDGDTLVIQAELPGLDPSQEITIWVDGGVVHLRAARRCGPLPGDETTDLRGGVFSRDITLLAGHPGAALRPLSRVASGGELSRIALALAATTSAQQPVGTLIFDEVDAGIGGAVAHTVGRLLAGLGQGRQVLAVTHLAQVAACSSRHLQVSKQSAGGGTQSHIAALDAGARVTEIARMLGGDTESVVAQAHARELLQSALSAGQS